MTVVEGSLRSGDGRDMSCADVHDAAMSIEEMIRFLIKMVCLLIVLGWMSLANILRIYVIPK